MKSMQFASRLYFLALGIPFTLAQSLTVGNYESVGCWEEPPQARALTSGFNASDSMTLELCAAKCNGYQFWGTEYGRECYCGSSLSPGTIQAPEADCSFPCPGNQNETCGAGLRLSLFNSTIPATLPPVPTAVANVGPFSLLGCYTEGNGKRALEALVIVDGGMTNEFCGETCGGFNMFGTEYGDECYCGNVLADGSVLASSGECNLLCVGNGTELCGGTTRLNLYTRTISLGPLSTSEPSSSVLTTTSSSSSTTLSSSSSQATSISNSTSATSPLAFARYLVSAKPSSTSLHIESTHSSVSKRFTSSVKSDPFPTASYSHATTKSRSSHHLGSSKQVHHRPISTRRASRDRDADDTQ